MHEAFEHRGIWWLPEAPDLHIHGLLTFDPARGATLTLMGSFTRLPNDLSAQRTPFIHGTAATGEAITLHACRRGSIKMGSHRLPSVEYRCATVFVGAHLLAVDGLPISTVSVEYTGLSEWVALNNILADFSDTPRKCTITCEVPEPRELATTPAFSLSIAADVKWGESLKKASIEQRWAFQFDRTDSHSVDALMDDVRLMQQFLTLAMGTPSYPATVQMALRKSLEDLAEETARTKASFSRMPELPADFELPEPDPHIWFTVHEAHTSHGKEPVTVWPHEMVFTLPDSEDRLAAAIPMWFQKAPLLKPVLDAYFGALFSAHIYLEHEFLSIIQALETFHRRTMQDTERLKVEHKIRMARILAKLGEQDNSESEGTSEEEAEDDCETGDGKWLEDRLHYAYEPNLRTRLQEIMNCFPEEMKLLIDASNKQRKGFIHKVHVSRNYYTHYGEDSYSRAAHGVDLWHLTRKLRVILQLCLLSEIGFEAEQFRRVIQRQS